MSINLIPEDALPKLFFLEADRDSDWRESQRNWLATGEAEGLRPAATTGLGRSNTLTGAVRQLSPMAAGAVTA
jgi:hypothetical protein